MVEMENTNNVCAEHEYIQFNDVISLDSDLQAQVDDSRKKNHKHSINTVNIVKTYNQSNRHVWHWNSRVRTMAGRRRAKYTLIKLSLVTRRPCMLRRSWGCNPNIKELD